MLLIKEHPFIFTGLMCLVCTAVTGVTMSVISCCIAAFVMFLCCCGFSAFAALGVPEKSFRSVFFSLCGVSAMLSLMFGFMLSQSQKPGLVILNSGLCMLTAAAVYFLVLKKMDVRKAIILIFIAGFLMRLAYIITLSIRIKQHDVGSVESMEGHLGYIAYLVYNGHLPDMDVRNVYQFYHPPLHHIIAAIWVKLQSLLMPRSDSIWENIQVLTMFYSCCCMILSYKIFRELGLSGKGLAAAFAVIAFCPTFYIMSGSINNDILSITLMLAAILNTLYWYKSRSMGRILCIALSVGFAMMAKLSGWMVAPAIAFIFLYVFFKEIKKFKKYLLQFGAFLGVCVPIALWWEVRNYISHEVPFTYIMELSKKSKQYIGNIPVTKRLFDFNFSQFQDVGDQFRLYGGKYNEYNPLVALFKTSMFDETFTTKFYPEIDGFNKLLFWSAVLLGVIGFAAMIYLFIRDKKLSGVHKIFLGTLYAVFMGSYYIFCIRFPQVCTENIRYAVPVIVIGAFFIGRLIYKMIEDNRKKPDIVRQTVSYFTMFVTSVYSLMSILTYDIVFINI